MSKLGLCVRYDCDNYGSMLQIYATQKVIKDLGADYEIIRYDKKTLGFMIKNVTRIFNPYFVRGKKMHYQKKKMMNAHPDIKKLNGIRLNRFKAYRKKYIGPYSPVYKGYNNLVKAADTYDAVVVGSDQLWTPAGIKSKFYNLIFVPDNVKKISFATSFGVSNIPKNQIKMTKYYLDRIDYLSVREIAGAKIVEDLTGKKPQVALDPTLLLSGEQWREVFPEKKSDSEEYIFAYYLGSNPKYRKLVKELGKKTGLKIITCTHMDEFVEADMDFGDEQRFDVDPIDFLNLIRGAKYICTDSFHGTVFSILNHKQFMTFNRFDSNEKQSRNSRIESLFSLLGLKDRHYVNDDLNLQKALDSEIDYEAVESKLSDLRFETIDFLKKALEERK